MKKLFTGLNINNMFFRLMLYFLIMLIPIIITGAVTYSYSIDSMKNDFSNAIKLNLKASSDTIDIYVKAAKETSMNFLYNNTVQSILVPYEKLSLEQKSQLSKIPRIIALNQNVVSLFIENIFVYLDNSRVYTREGMEDYQDFFTKFNIYEKYGIDFWNELLKAEREYQILEPSRVMKYNSDVERYIIPIITVIKIGDYNIAVVIEFSSDTILKTIKNNSTVKNTEFIVLDEKNNLISCSNEKYIAEIGIISGSISDDMQYSEIKLSANKMLITNVISDSLGWKYYSITPVSEFGKHSEGILRMTLLVCGILVIIGICLSYIFSISLYSPIRNIRNILMNEYSASEAEQAKNEIEMIGKRIHHLLEDKNNYKNTLQKVSNEYSDNSFLNLIRGIGIEYEDGFKHILTKELKFTHPRFMCCNIRFDFKEEFYAEIQDIDRLNILEGMKKIIWALFDEKLPTYVLDLKKNMYVCIINLRDNSEQGLVMESIDNIIKTFEYDQKYYDIIFGIGKIYSDLNDLSRSYGDAMIAMESGRIEGEKIQILHSGSIQTDSHIYYTFTDEMKIINCLKAGDKAGVKNILEGIFNEGRMKAAGNHNPDALALEIYNTGIRYVAGMGLDINQYIQHGNVYFNKTGQEIVLALSEFFNNIIDNLAGMEGMEIGTLPSMIIQYVKANYHKDIYLEKVAEEMGVSASYISKLFKQKTGMNLTEYISMVRIEKAKELLANTNMRVNDVSENVGIYSRTTFVRLFKKFEGVTPSQYREIIVKTTV